MVPTWITNSISKELVNAFTHIDNSFKLWNALTHRFGGSNGHKILKLQREISRFTCTWEYECMMYFNHLNELWDEMDMLHPLLNCICAAKGKYNKREMNLDCLLFSLD